MKTIEVECSNCHNKFQKRRWEYFNSIKLKRSHCCSRSCAISIKNKSMSKKYWKQLYQQNKSRHDIAQYNKDHPRIDVFSPFRIFTIRVHQSGIVKKYGTSDLTVEYLKDLWDKQNGKCGYTGLKMTLPKSVFDYHKTHSIKKVSLDRIDSQKGYIKGNVHFVCLSINLAKKNLPHNDMIEFIQEIKSAGNIPGTS